MGVVFEFLWPGLTDETLDTAHDEGGTFSDKDTYLAFHQLQHPYAINEDKINRLRARYDLDSLCILQPNPDEFDDFFGPDDIIYKTPVEVAAALERLLMALTGRDPDAEPLVVASISRDRDFPRKVNDDDWDILRKNVEGLLGQARWLEKQGIEKVYFAIYW